MTHPLTQVVLTVSSCRLLLAASCSLPPARCLLPYEPSLAVGLLTLPSAFCLLPSAFCLLPPASCLLPYEPSLTVGLLTLPSAFCLVSPPLRLGY